MDRQLAGALAELGLSATEAEIYVALLRLGASGPVSAYKLAQDMGRDPANMTKTLAAMTKRGAVRASGRKPRLYAPIAPEEFTGELIARLQARQRQAVELLREIGQPPEDERLRTLTSRREALDIARRLLAGARRVVLCDAAAEVLTELGEALAAAAARQGATVLVKSTAAVDLPRVQIWLDQSTDALLGTAPGPWLRLAVDGDGCLQMLARPDENDDLLHGHWSRCPTRSFLEHRALAADLILADTHELLAGGATGELARRRAAERAGLLLRLVNWRQRWHEAGLPDYEPLLEQATELDPGEVAAAMAELAAEAGAGAPAGTTAANRSPGEQAGPAGEAEADEDQEGGPLQFIFRRRRKS